MIWYEKLKWYDKQPGISDEELKDINNYLSQALTLEERDELKNICKTLEGINFESWVIPSIKLPVEYQELLAFSNGGGIINGDREFGFFGKNHIRDYYIRYLFPEFIPGALPIGFNGSGIFYAYDLRESFDKPTIIATASGVLNWDDAVIIGNSIEEVMGRSNDIADELYKTTDNEQEEFDKQAEKDDFTYSLKGIFDHAAILFKNKNYTEVVEVLSKYEKHLDKINKTRLKYAKKKALT